MEGVENGMLCNKCTLKEHIKDGHVLLESLFDIINAEQEQTLLFYILELLDEKQISELVSDINENEDYDIYGVACNL
jgi:hypothetical protein